MTFVTEASVKPLIGELVSAVRALRLQALYRGLSSDEGSPTHLGCYHEGPTCPSVLESAAKYQRKAIRFRGGDRLEPGGIERVARTARRIIPPRGAANCYLVVEPNLFAPRQRGWLALRNPHPPREPASWLGGPRGMNRRRLATELAYLPRRRGAPFPDVKRAPGCT